jgi:uncharacterized protein YejL (UPF0352 family)
VEKTAVKESDILKKVVSIMDKHVPSRKEIVVLKAVVELKTSNSLSMEDLECVFQNYHEWENKMVEIAVLKERHIMDGIANLLDKHKALDIAVKVLKGNQLTKVFMSFIYLKQFKAECVLLWYLYCVIHGNKELKGYDGTILFVYFLYLLYVVVVLSVTFCHYSKCVWLLFNFVLLCLSLLTISSFFVFSMSTFLCD